VHAAWVTGVGLVLLAGCLLVGRVLGVPALVALLLCWRLH